MSTPFTKAQMVKWLDSIDEHDPEVNDFPDPLKYMWFLQSKKFAGQSNKFARQSTFFATQSTFFARQSKSFATHRKPFAMQSKKFAGQSNKFARQSTFDRISILDATGVPMVGKSFVDHTG